MVSAITRVGIRVGFLAVLLCGCEADSRGVRPPMTFEPRGSTRQQPGQPAPETHRPPSEATQPNVNRTGPAAELVEAWQGVPEIEARLVESIARDGVADHFVIRDIRPIGSGSTKGRICIAGRGSLPLATGSRERLGEGVVLEWITPVQRGAEINVQKGRSAIIVKNQNVDANTANFSVGAIWEKLPMLIDGHTIDDMCGVAFSPGIRLGALYDRDGDLAFDYVQAGAQVIQCPAGSAGSVHRLVGDINMGPYTFHGENDPLQPLTFLLSPEGYVHLRGRGVVTLPDGKRVPLDPAEDRASKSNEPGQRSGVPPIRQDLGVRSPGPAEPGRRDGQTSKPVSDPARDADVIHDAARIKLLLYALGPTGGGFVLQPDGRILARELPKPIVDSITKELGELLNKCNIDLAECGVHSEAVGASSAVTGGETELSLEMEEWADIITVTPEDKFPAVKLKSGSIRLKLPSMEVVFEEGAVCSVSGSKYEYRNEGWTPTDSSG